MGKIVESMKKLAPMLNKNSFEVGLPKINHRDVVVYPTNAESNTEKYIFRLYTNGKVKLLIDRVSDLFFEKEYDNFDSLLIDFIQLEMSTGKGYDQPQFIDLLPIIDTCSEFTCTRYTNSTTLKAYYVDENNSLLVDVTKREIRYMTHGHISNKFNSELKITHNIKDIYNVANAMKYVARLHQIDIFQLCGLATQCLFNEDRTVEFIFQNNHSLRIAYFESTDEWKVKIMKKENDRWVKIDKIITKDYSDVESKIQYVINL